MKTINQRIALNLRRLRRHHGLSQEAVAARIGISRNMYLRYESGTSLPPARRLATLADLYHIPIRTITDSDLASDGPASTDINKHPSVPLYEGLEELIAQYDRLSALSRKVVMEEIQLLQEIEHSAYSGK